MHQHRRSHEKPQPMGATTLLHSLKVWARLHECHREPAVTGSSKRESSNMRSSASMLASVSPTAVGSEPSHRSAVMGPCSSLLTMARDSSSTARTCHCSHAQHETAERYLMRCCQHCNQIPLLWVLTSTSLVCNTYPASCMRLSCQVIQEMLCFTITTTSPCYVRATLCADLHFNNKRGQYLLLSHALPMLAQRLV